MVAEQYLNNEVDLVEPDGPNKTAYLIYEDEQEPLTKQQFKDIEGEILLILNSMSTPGGYRKNEVLPSVLEEFFKKDACLKMSVHMEGAVSGDSYLHPIKCGKWWCPRCGTYHGGKKGLIQRDRQQAVYARLNGGNHILTPEDYRNFIENVIKKITVIQYVLTVPEDERVRFKSKLGINQLLGSARRLIEKIHPGAGMIAYVHLYGDKSTKFNPHVNVHVILKGSVRVIPEDGDLSLDRLKKGWVNALRGHGCQIEGVQGVDIHKSFIDGSARGKKPGYIQILHRIKYMTKPIDQKYLETWKKSNDYEEIRFTVSELKGYRYLRYWGALSNSKYKEFIIEPDGEEKMNKKDMEKLAGEPLIYRGLKRVSIEQLMQDDTKTVTQIGHNFYVVKSKGVKKCPGTSLQPFPMLKL